MEQNIGMSQDQQKEEIRQKFGNRLRLRVSGICIQDEKVLMIKHQSIGQGDYLWAPPGGGMNFGENARQTLIREFLEETGLEIEVGQFLFVNEFLDPPLHAIELFFEVKVIGGNLKKGKDPEMSADHQIIEKVAFLGIEDIQKENFRQIHGVFRNIENISFILEKRGYDQSNN